MRLDRYLLIFLLIGIKHKQLLRLLRRRVIFLKMEKRPINGAVAYIKTGEKELSKLIDSGKNIPAIS